MLIKCTRINTIYPLASFIKGVLESSKVQMRCLRTWQATDMAGMGNDSLGTFFLMAENNATELADGTSKLYVGVSQLIIIKYC